jgi:hypothetical protein
MGKAKRSGVPTCGCQMGKWLMTLGSWDAGETSGVAHCRLELAEKGRSNFKKTNLRYFTDPVDDAMEKSNGEVDDAAGKGGGGD